MTREEFMAVPDELLAWPLDSVLRELRRAAKHLLDDHDCDGHGHELIRTAECMAGKWREHLATFPTPALVLREPKGDR
jgi:hypothetical protein